MSIIAIETVLLARRIQNQPGMRELIRAKVEQLRSEGFFDRFPAPTPQEGEQHHEKAHPNRAVPA